MFASISVPTPFKIGRVNTYVAGKTIVDPGPDSDQAWEVLCDGLAEQGLTPADIEQVIVTHAHLDHFGLAKRLRDAGAEIIAHPHTKEIIADYRARLRREQAYFEPLFKRLGVDAMLAETVVTLPDPYLTYGPPVETDRTLADGESINVNGTELTVEYTGGHGPGELALAYEADGEKQAIVGDTVLGHLRAVPFMIPPRTEGEQRPKQLVRLEQALESLEAGNFDRFLPGHGEHITDTAGRITEMRNAHAHRTADVKSLVTEPVQPAEVMDGVFGEMPATETFSSMSETMGHLELLEHRGELERELRDGAIYYRPAE